MTDGTAESNVAPGWGIDWSSRMVHRRFFATAVAFALINSLSVIAGTVVIGPIVDQDAAALLAGLVGVAVFSALTAVLVRSLRPWTSHHGDFGKVKKTASKVDLIWSVAWITIVFMIPGWITIAVFGYFELKPFWSILAIFFVSNVVITLYPFVVMTIRGPEAAPLRTPTKDDEIRHAKRSEKSILVYAFFILYAWLAAVAVIFVVAISKLT